MTKLVIKTLPYIRIVTLRLYFKEIVKTVIPHKTYEDS